MAQPHQNTCQHFCHLNFSLRGNGRSYWIRSWLQLPQCMFELRKHCFTSICIRSIAWHNQLRIINKWLGFFIRSKTKVSLTRCALPNRSCTAVLAAELGTGEQASYNTISTNISRVSRLRGMSFCLATELTSSLIQCCVGINVIQLLVDNIIETYPNLINLVVSWTHEGSSPYLILITTIIFYMCRK